MNFNEIFKVGETLTAEYTVDFESTAAHIGNVGVEVLSTPSMIRFMETTCARILFKKIPKNYRPVGSKINIDHISSTPVHMRITVKSTLESLEGKKARFNVEAFNEKTKIGCGIIEQHIINIEDFLNKQNK